MPDEEQRGGASEAESGFEALLRDDRAAPREPTAGEGGNGLPAVGEVLDGKYRIDAPLGEGGMGAVYRATHVGTGRSVALKVLVPELTANAAAVERFQREAKAAGAMRHANIVDVTDFGFAERSGRRVAYLVMELLEGETLRALLAREKRLPLDTAVDLLGQVCSAVAEAHGRGILHRDLKPENIHVRAHAGRYHVKVLDFGIAKLIHDGAEAVDAGPRPGHAEPGDLPTFGEAATIPASMRSGRSLTRLGARIGTPRYMSPEQWRGDAVDERSDVYALGLVAYEVLTGEPVVTEAGERPIAGTLAAKVPSLPWRIVQTVEGALAAERGERPPSAAAFAAALGEGAETTWKLLRRSVAFAIDHYSLLFQSTLPFVLTMVAYTVVVLLVTVLLFFGRLSQPSAGLTLGASTLAFLAAMCAVSPPIAGRIAVQVAEISAGLSLRRHALELRRTITAALPSNLVMSMMIVFALLISSIPQGIMMVIGKPVGGTAITLLLYNLIVSAIGAPMSLYPHAVFVERLSGLAPLRRSRALLRPLRWVAFGVILALAFVVELPQMVVAGGSELAHQLAPASRVRLALDVLSVVIPMGLAILYMPLAFVPGAMLYLRAREAEGNPFLPDAPAPPAR